MAFSIYRITDFVGTSQLPWFYLITLLAGLILATLFGFGLLRLMDNSKVNLSILTLSITLPILGFEAYLEFSSPSLQQITIATHRADVINDTRTKINVIDDFRSIGIDAYPNVSGSQFISTNGLANPLSEENIYPLGAISNKTTVYCNESGEWTIFESDEHGFNNPKGLYVKNNVDIMLTGDSFAEGACVKPNETIAAVLRESGINVISLGKGGNGSLLEFASFKEYVEPLQPKVVLWIHYANDIGDLREKGMESSLLMNYLNDDDFSQTLISRQDEIDEALKNYVDRRYTELKETVYRNSSPSPLMRIMKLTNLGNNIKMIKEEQTAKIERKETMKEWIAIKRAASEKSASAPSTGKTAQQWMILGEAGKAKHAYETAMGIGSWSKDIHQYLKRNILNDKKCLSPLRPEPSLDNALREILMRANRIVSKWDGKLYFVWLHSRERYDKDTNSGQEDYEWPGYYREYILCTAKEVGIPIIDIHQSVFAPHPDPLSLFPFRKAQHYSADGYRLVAEEISSRLMMRY
jgi:hypothetical protein